MLILSPVSIDDPLLLVLRKLSDPKHALGVAWILCRTEDVAIVGLGAALRASVRRLSATETSKARDRPDRGVQRVVSCLPDSVSRERRCALETSSSTLESKFEYA